LPDGSGDVEPVAGREVAGGVCPQVPPVTSGQVQKHCCGGTRIDEGGDEHVRAEEVFVAETEDLRSSG